MKETKTFTFFDIQAQKIRRLKKEDVVVTIQQSNWVLQGVENLILCKKKTYYALESVAELNRRIRG